MHRSDAFYQRRWGVFVHYLEKAMNYPANPRSLGRHTSWDECLEDFDCDRFAQELAQVGAGYAMITLMQQTRYLLAPNDTFNKLTGYKPGEACPSFDFVDKLYKALNKHGIDLFLYFTGDGPTHDEKAEAAFGTIRSTDGQVSAEFVKKWAWVAEEYSRHYGAKIKGWWLDGCYYNIGYDAQKLQVLADACRAGNPDALVACNVYGCMDEKGIVLRHIRRGAPCDDYAAGEQEDFGDLPYSPFIGGVRWHILSYLGDREHKRLNARYSPEWLRDYVRAANEAGGVVTMDLGVYRDGHIEPAHLRALSLLKGGEG